MLIEPLIGIERLRATPWVRFPVEIIHSPSVPQV
jgi:hypothetical protein